VGAVPGEVAHLLTVKAGSWWESGVSLLVLGLALGVDLYGVSVGSSIGVVVLSLSVGSQPVKVHGDVGVVHTPRGI
jgi:hypothetical protein